LDVRNHLSDWWLSCAWKHVPEHIRELCWKHATFRLKNFPRFAHDHDGVREVLDVRNHLSDWWLSCAWKHVPEHIRELCWKHATFRLKNFPRFARDCCDFVNKTTCFCFYLASDTCLNVLIVEICGQKQILPSSTGDGTSANPYIL
jgi:hypothetical protein